MAERMALLDETGIDAEILSVSQAQPYLPAAAESAGAAQLANDLYQELCSQYPRRFYTFAALPLPHIDASLEEIERIAASPYCVGFTMGCSVAGRPLDDPVFQPVFEELDHRHCVVFLHPVGREDISWLADYNMAWLVGAPFEDTVTALRLVLSGTTRRYPHIRFIVPHLGGTLPFLSARIMRQNDDSTVIQELRKMYYDTVSGSPAALDIAAGAFGAGHLLFGTDYPYCTATEFAHHLAYLGDAHLGEEDLISIRGREAAQLLGISPPA